MIDQKDYLRFFKELYALEIEMEKEGKKLKKLIENKEIQDLLDYIIRDEKKHQKIVKELIDLAK